MSIRINQKFLPFFFRLAQWPGDQRRPLGQHRLPYWRAVCHDQLGHLCRPGQARSSAGEPGSFGHCHRNRGRNREHRSSCRTGEDDPSLPSSSHLQHLTWYLHRCLVSGVLDREQAGLDVCFLLLHRHGKTTAEHSQHVWFKNKVQFRKLMMLSACVHLRDSHFSPCVP